MQITVSTPNTGVFFAPGLAKPVTIELNTLPKDESQRIMRLIKESNFFEQPEIFGASKSARDTEVLRITIKDGERFHSVDVSAPFSNIKNESLKILIEELLVRRQQLIRGIPDQ
jgi:hypothetical protein